MIPVQPESLPPSFEANLDGLVGPTHNYAGLSFGNVASARNRGRVANPRAAALQGLAKMRYLVEAGIPQLLMPPQIRPDFDFLHALGFRGSEAAVLAAAHKADPTLLAAAWSASSMWTANAATFTPSADNAHSNAHVTPANLISTSHRSLESFSNSRRLRLILPEAAGFQHHAPLPAQPRFSDEGAANHTRFAPEPGMPGLHVFAYGRSARDVNLGVTSLGKYPARQTLEASQSLARLHGLPDKRVIYLRQSRRAIEAGVFHNDVIATGHGGMWLVHEDAYENGVVAIADVARQYQRLFQQPLTVLKVGRRQLTLDDAVTSYLFNSQLVTLPTGGVELICAGECRRHAKVWGLLQQWIEEGFLQKVTCLDLRQSMRNGGGPACLRLRLILTPAQWRAIPVGYRMDSQGIAVLERWVRQHYRDRLSPRDLLDTTLAEEAATAIGALENLIG